MTPTIDPNLAPPPATDDAHVAALLGPARLAFFTPVYEQQQAADRKATFILTASGLVVTTLLFFLHPVVAILKGERGHPVMAWVLLALLATLAGLLLAGARAAYAAFVWPLPPMPPSLAFFRHIAARRAGDYAREMAALDHAGALDAILHYNYSVAVQGAGKFRHVNRALACMRVAIPLWMLTLLLVAVWR